MSRIASSPIAGCLVGVAIAEVDIEINVLLNCLLSVRQEQDLYMARLAFVVVVQHPEPDYFLMAAIIESCEVFSSV